MVVVVQAFSDQPCFRRRAFFCVYGGLLRSCLTCVFFSAFFALLVVVAEAFLVLFCFFLFFAFFLASLPLFLPSCSASFYVLFVFQASMIFLFLFSRVVTGCASY